MNYSPRLSLFLFASMIAAANAMCYICDSSDSKVFNTALVYQLQDDRLWGQREWTCNQLESAALAGQFNDDECGHARDIAVRFCNCRDKDWSPTVETTPVCEFCPGANPLDPQKWINTYVGGMTCQDLVQGGRDSYWPEVVCAQFKQDNLGALCCDDDIAASPGVGLDGCFSGNSMVRVQNQQTAIRMEDLGIGDMVDVGGGKFSRVYSFGHRNVDTSTEYVQIFFGDQVTALEMTNEHMVFVERMGPVPASMVTVGDKLVLGDGSVSSVTQLSTVTRQGAYAPFTESGTLVVNNVLASSFISVKDQSSSLIQLGGIKIGSLHWLAHAFEAPHRMVCRRSPSVCESETYTAEGISHWVNTPFAVSRWLVNQNTLVMGAVSVGVMLICATFYLVEAVTTNGWLFALLGIAMVHVCRKRTKCV